MNYEEYLFGELLKEENKEFAEMPYDEFYDKIPNLFSGFENSEYNNEEQDLQHCLRKYIKNTTIYPIEYENLSCEELFQFIGDYYIGTTSFPEKEKKFLAASYYNSLIEYLENKKLNVEEELSGYEGAYQESLLKIFYGATIKDVLIKIVKYYYEDRN